jgi:hypothetical protein
VPLGNTDGKHLWRAATDAGFHITTHHLYREAITCQPRTLATASGENQLGNLTLMTSRLSRTSHNLMTSGG